MFGQPRQSLGKAWVLGYLDSCYNGVLGCLVCPRDRVAWQPCGINTIVLHVLLVGKFNAATKVTMKASSILFAPLLVSAAPGFVRNGIDKLVEKRGMSSAFNHMGEHQPTYTTHSRDCHSGPIGRLSILLSICRCCSMQWRGCSRLCHCLCQWRMSRG